MSDVKQITDAEFEKSIAEGIVLVDFWAPWCGPCKILGPIIEKVAQEFKDSVKVFKLNTDENDETPSKFQISGIPTVMIFKNGEMVERLVGAYPEMAYKEILQKYI